MPRAAEAELARQGIWGRTNSRHPGELQIEHPPAGELRVRRLVHRGTQRPVFKVPSVTLARVVQCESLLEVDMAMLLDACPHVASYREQPVTLRYVVGEEEVRRRRPEEDARQCIPRDVHEGGAADKGGAHLDAGAVK